MNKRDVLIAVGERLEAIGLKSAGKALRIEGAKAGVLQGLEELIKNLPREEIASEFERRGWTVTRTYVGLVMNNAPYKVRIILSWYAEGVEINIIKRP